MIFRSKNVFLIFLSTTIFLASSIANAKYVFIKSTTGHTTQALIDILDYERTSTGESIIASQYGKFLANNTDVREESYSRATFTTDQSKAAIVTLEEVATANGVLHRIKSRSGAYLSLTPEGEFYWRRPNALGWEIFQFMPFSSCG
jgi:hypothetical protein